MDQIQIYFPYIYEKKIIKKNHSDCAQYIVFLQKQFRPCFKF